MASKKTILKWKKANSRRVYMPFKDFANTYQGIVEAEKEIASTNVSSKTKRILHRAYIISIVTALEVYFRDMFAVLVRQMLKDKKPVKLAPIHRFTYSVDEIQSQLQDKILPYDLVANSVNFQNYQQIGRAFTCLLGRSFWPAVLAQKIPMDTKHGTSEFTLSEENMNHFRETLTLRHELIHQSFHSKRKLTHSELDGVITTLLVVRVANHVLVEHLIADLL